MESFVQKVSRITSTFATSNWKVIAVEIIDFPIPLVQFIPQSYIRALSSLLSIPFEKLISSCRLQDVDLYLSIKLYNLYALYKYASIKYMFMYEMNIKRVWVWNMAEDECGAGFDPFWPQQKPFGNILIISNYYVTFRNRKKTL